MGKGGVTFETAFVIFVNYETLIKTKLQPMK